MFSHEKLNVYNESVRFATEMASMSAQWDRKHAFIDHLYRASESIILNLAEGCRTTSFKAKQLALDYSLGSVLECAGCIDIAHLKLLLRYQSALERKKSLVRIFGKLVGLRKSWAENIVREDHGEYEVGAGKRRIVFHHEKLDVYQVALKVIEQLNVNGLCDQLPTKVFRQIDEVSTSIVLNIAEGNGRFSELDQERFMQMTNRLTVKLATLLDLCLARKLWECSQVAKIKKLLERIASMSATMSRIQDKVNR